MKSITLHKLDPALARELELRSRAAGRSLNKTAQELLRAALGLDPKKREDRTETFRDLFGSWKAEDLREFNKRTGDLTKVDPADWEG